MKCPEHGGGSQWRPGYLGIYKAAQHKHFVQCVWKIVEPGGEVKSPIAAPHLRSPT